MIDTAPIAVKWWLQIASVSSSAPPIFHFSLIAVQPNRKRDRADRGAEQDRGDHQDGVPQHDARDLERGHARVMHGGYAAGDDGAADPRTVTPVPNQRHRESRARQQDGGDQ